MRKFVEELIILRNEYKYGNGLNCSLYKDIIKKTRLMLHRVSYEFVANI